MAAVLTDRYESVTTCRRRVVQDAPVYTAPPPKPAPEHKSRTRRVCRMCGFCCMGFVGLLLLGGLGFFAMNDFNPTRTSTSFSFAMMRFFRDVSRIKARRRRFGQVGQVMPVLGGYEKPLPLADPSLGLSLSAEELADFDGRQLPDSQERAPLLLAIKGRIYDVSAGRPFYGPGSKYHRLTGRDATRAFCTGCLDPNCLIASTEGLSEAQMREADRWVELYEHHDKYKLVGQLREVSPAEGVEGDSASEDTDDDERKVLEAAAAEDAEAKAAYERELVERAQHAEGSKHWKPFRFK